MIEQQGGQAAKAEPYWRRSVIGQAMAQFWALAMGLMEGTARLRVEYERALDQGDGELASSIERDGERSTQLLNAMLNAAEAVDSGKVPSLNEFARQDPEAYAFLKKLHADVWQPIDEAVARYASEAAELRQGREARARTPEQQVETLRAELEGLRAESDRLRRAQENVLQRLTSQQALAKASPSNPRVG